MSIHGGLYGGSLALLTDLYQLTMAYGYWKTGVAEREAVFCLQFRRNPFGGGFTVACGLQAAMEYLSGLRFTADDLAYLADLKGNDGRALFAAEFLDYLAALEFQWDIDAVPEGTVVFPYEPLLRVRAPILQAQIVETALLNLINFQTLIATKAARICLAARGEPVLEFGLRRAQGIDGGVSASRAAYIGGCAATSNVLAGKLFGIPVRGTLAHSWIMFYDDERAAFEQFADAMPNNCVFLVDTYNTLDGVRNAISVGKRLRSNGHKLAGIRLDSGDLAYLSIEARRLLDEGGFQETAIMASNDLDENVIESLRQQGAAINVWGVGTRLATAYDEPALGGVYKLAAVRLDDGRWDHRIKLSEQTAKTSLPGLLQIRRFRSGEGFIADAIYDEIIGPRDARTIVDPTDPLRQKKIPSGAEYEDLLKPVMIGGKRTGALPDIETARARTKDQLAALHMGVKRFLHPHQYPAGLERTLHDLRTEMVDKAHVRIGMHLEETETEI